MTLQVDAVCPGLLVLPDTYFPGWKATVNGEKQTIYATDGAFRGVTVPQGSSRVEFRYELRAFPLGIAIAIAGLVTFMVVWLVSVWRRRREVNPRVGDGSPPGEPTVGGNDPAERVDVRRAEFVGMRREVRPRIPRCADQLSRDAVALLRGEEDSQTSSKLERCSPTRSLLERTLVRGRADALWAGMDDVVEEPRVERARRDRIDVNPGSTHSSASVSANRTTPAFDAAYAPRRGRGAVAPPPES